VGSPAIASDVPSEGCYPLGATLSGGQAGQLPKGVLSLSSSSGNPSLDAAMIFELKRILMFFPINPGFKYFDDSKDPNAYAWPPTIVKGTKHSIFIGLTFIENEFNDASLGGIAVAGIMAHECGHVYQFDHDFSILEGPTHRGTELHADLLAGWYFGASKSRSRDGLLVFSNSMFKKGDTAFTDEGHHGTADERVRAVATGYDLGSSGLPIDEAAQKGAQEIASWPVADH
jgi:hypothetical protein